MKGILFLSLWCVCTQAFVSGGTTQVKPIDGRSSRVLIVDEKIPEDIHNSTKDEKIIPKSDTLTLHKVDGSSEHLWKTEHGELVKVIKLDESNKKTPEEGGLIGESFEDCPINQKSDDDLAARVTELLKQAKKKPRSPSIIGRSTLGPKGQSPYPGLPDSYRYRSYLRPQGSQSPYGENGSAYSRSDSASSRGRTFWPFTLLYDNYYDYPPPPPPPYYPPPPPYYPPPPPPYGPWR